MFEEDVKRRGEIIRFYRNGGWPRLDTLLEKRNLETDGRGGELVTGDRRWLWESLRSGGF